MSLTWEQRKQIGTALGWSVSPEKAWDRTVFALKQGEAFWNVYPTEEAAWNAYQPDVLGEVIPWLERNTVTWDCGRHIIGSYGASAILNKELIVTVGRNDIFATFSEAVCALMLAILESGVTA